MIAYPCEIPGPVLISGSSFHDARGSFSETYSHEKMRNCIPHTFVQDNEIRSVGDVVRGLHYNLSGRQGKLVRSVVGSHRSIAVDMRRHSSTFGKMATANLFEGGCLMFWVPPGFAHAVLCMTSHGVLQYKSTTQYGDGEEVSINPLSFGADWLTPESDLILSDKDRMAPTFAEWAKR